MLRNNCLASAIVSLPLAFGGAALAQPPAKPNIVMIMADDVGIWNISAYHRGMMGGSTPNIDRIAREGCLFTDYYAQQSCTAGRAAFILGQTPFRTGLLTVGLPAAKEGIQDKDPTIAELLKPLGYATAQIGKNHLGDRNEFLPTVHGFDEFYGILYHLNAMEEPYEYDYPKVPNFRASFGPRNIVDTKASTVDDPTVDPRWGKVGKQTIVDGGPLPPHPNMDPHSQDQHGRYRRRTGSPFRRFHGSLREGQQAVLPLAQFHAHPCVDASFSEMAGQERLRPLCRRHDGTGRGSRLHSQENR
jgi:arylsulfatase